MAKFLDYNGVGRLIEHIKPPLVEIINNGAKNIADMTYATDPSSTSNGCILSKSGENFTITGTSAAAANPIFNIYIRYVNGSIVNILPPGKYTAMLYGTDIDNITIQACINGTSDNYGKYGQPHSFEISENTTNNWVRVVCKSGSVSFDSSFKLMICSQIDYAVFTEYQSYRPALTARINESDIDNIWSN